MLRQFILAAALMVAVPALSEEAHELQTLQQLQQGLSQSIQELQQAKGELKAVTEYHIKQQTQALRDELKSLMDEDNASTAQLLPLIVQQQKQLQAFDRYFDKELAALAQQLGQGNDAKLMLAISRRGLEKDAIFRDQLELLQWEQSLGADTSKSREQLKQQLLTRAQRLQSLISYNQQQITQQNNEISVAGADASNEQKAALAQLKERLNNNSDGLRSDIAMLDELDADTAELKQTLFSVSGNITQDVLNVGFISNLFQHWLETAESKLIDGGPEIAFKLLIFLLILFCAHLLARLAERLVRKAVGTSKLNFSMLLQDFFTGLSGKVVMTLGLLIALSQLGFELGPLLAGFGIAGVIIGFALQDTLSNFASGMMILIYRPFDVGDLIVAAGVTGRVSHMSLVSTTIKTLDNQRLIVPNNKIWGDTINNITAEQYRRIDMTFGISYSDDIEQAENVLTQIVKNHPKVLTFPESNVRLHLLNESSVDFIVRPWVAPDDYWEVYWDITRAVKMRFDQEGISIPFPQRDVHFYRG